MNAAAIDTALVELKTLLPGQVFTDPETRLTYETDAGLIGKGTPDAVALPQSAADVQTLAAWSARHDIPLVARAAGTGLAGGAVPHRGGVVVAFPKMKQILEIDEAGRQAAVQANVVNQTLADAVAARGLYFPPDPSSGRSSAIGGNIGTNAGGPHCFKYGVMSNYVTGIDVVLADGRAVTFGGRALDYPEYDLRGLMVGSEGTLGLITAAHLRLIRTPPAVQTLMAAFDSVEQAGQAVSDIIARGLVPATLEMMDQQIMRIIEDFNQPGLPVDSGASLILEVDGYPQSLRPQIDEVAQILQPYNCEIRVAHTAEERAKIWFGRKSAAGALSRLAPIYYLIDGTVPRSQLAQTLVEINQICRDDGVQVGYVFHAGDGNLHPLILIPDPNDHAFVERVHEAGRKIVQCCVNRDGSLTGEHGVGLEKRDFMPMMFNPAELSAMQDIKSVFDPHNLLNPGKVLPPDISRPAAPPPSDDMRRRLQTTNLFEPESADEAAEAMRVWSATEPRRTVRVQGGGTKSALLPPADVLLSTRKLTGVRAYARDDYYVTVGAGTRLSELEETLAADNMWLPLVSPWPEATVGGIVAANFNAPLRMRYGSARDLLLVAKTVLPDGRVIRAGRPVVKNVAGYDLPKLLAGSRGTLGLITEITLKIAPRPRAQAGLVVPVDNLAHGLAWGSALLKICLAASGLVLAPAGDLPGVSAPLALVYTAEGLPEDVTAEMDEVRATLKHLDSPAPLPAEISATQHWADILRATTPTKTLMHAGVAPGNLPGFVTTLAPDAISAPFVADLANGMLYLCGAEAAPVQRAARALGGYATVLRAPAAPADVWGHAPDGLDLMQAIKQRWDPHNILAPDAFIL